MSQQGPLNDTEDAGEGHSGGKRVSAFVWDLLVGLCQLCKEQQIKRQEQARLRSWAKNPSGKYLRSYWHFFITPTNPPGQKFNVGNKERTVLVQHGKVNSRTYDRLKTRDATGTQDRTQDKFLTPDPQLRKIHCGM